MLTVIVTSAVGTPPFQISLCDVTNTYCYIVGVDVTSFPVTLIVPPPIQSADTLLIKIIDAYYCETLQTTTSLSPTPTPTPTLTPSSYITNCNCIKFDNLNGVLDYYFSVTLCDGTEINSTIFSGTTLYYCGNSPTAEPEVGISIGPVCVDNTCPTPVYTPTLTSTPTLTNTPTLTQTPTLTSSSVPTNTPTPTLTNTPVSTNTPTPTPTPTITETPTNTPTQTQTPTPTNTITPTNTPTENLFLASLTPCSTPGGSPTNEMYLPMQYYPYTIGPFSGWYSTTVIDSVGNCYYVAGLSSPGNLPLLTWSGIDTSAWLNYYGQGQYTGCTQCLVTPTDTPTPTPTPTQTNTPTSTATPTPTPTLTPTSSETFFLLQENGYFILQENGGKIIWKPA